MAYSSFWRLALQLRTSDSADAFGRALEIDPSVNRDNFDGPIRDPALMPIKPSDAIAHLWPSLLGAAQVAPETILRWYSAVSKCFGVGLEI
jgi:hypothetical protein